METRTWIIIDLITNRALYGAEGKTLMFSTRDIADEVARQFFKKDEIQRFTIFNTATLITK